MALGTRAFLVCCLALLALSISFSQASPFTTLSERLAERELKWSQSVLTDVPLVDPPKRMAGQFKLNRTHDAHMFYFFFNSRTASSDPVVLWMTGGPGCSSELAIFHENGPYSLNKDLTISETQYGWDVSHHMIFVDQPINTGFSYSHDSRDRVTSEALVAQDMLDFLWEFFRVHPDLADNDFFVTGESYAGHYVPAVSAAIYRARELGIGPRINFKGLAIGNGLTVAGTQFPAYADFALQRGLISQGLHDSIAWWSPLCVWGADACNAYQWGILCTLANTVCQVTGFSRILAANPDINVYDITKKCEGALCYDFSDMDTFLNRADVRETLGVGTREWQACSPTVYSDFMSDWMKAYADLLPQMLEDDVRVLIYAGDLDLICNWLGNERWVDGMQWEGQGEWLQVNASAWRLGGRVAGTAREYDGLSFVKVSEAGHMVPMDQPAAALDLITRFTRGRSFVDAGASGKAATDPHQGGQAQAAGSVRTRAAHGLRKWSLGEGVDMQSKLRLPLGRKAAVPAAAL